MKSIVVAPMGDHMESLYVGIKEFQTEKVILITPKRYENEADEVSKDLAKFKIPTHIMKVGGESEIEIWESVFMAIAEIRNTEADKEVLINVATGDRTTRCAATSAAVVNGFKAFATDGDMAMMLPVMKFSYYKLIPEKKMSILKYLEKHTDCCSTIEELSKEYKGKAKICKVNVDQNPDIAEKYGIRGIPTIILFENGAVSEQLVGVQSKETLTAMINKRLS